MAINKKPEFNTPADQSEEGAPANTALLDTPAATIPGPTALGQGIKTFTGEGVSTALTANAGPPTGAIIHSTLTVCTSVEQVLETLNVSAGASFSDLETTVSGLASMVASMNISTTAVTLIVRVINVSGTKSLTSPAYIPNINTSLTAEQFFAAYGDSFVKTVTIGSSYFALYTFFTTTTTSQVALAAAINAQIGVGFSGFTQATLNQIVSNSNTVVHFDQVVTGVGPIELPNQNSVVSFAQKFTTLPLHGETILSYTQSGYETVPPPPRKTDWPWTPTSPLVNNRNAFVETVSPQTVQLAMVQGQFDALTKIYSAYGYTDPTLDASQKTLTDDFTAAKNYINGVNGDPTLARELPTFVTLKSRAPLPTPNFALNSQQVISFTGGGLERATPFNSPISSASIVAATVPSSITLSGISENGSAVCTGLTIAYTSPTTGTQSQSYGGGTAGTPLVLLPGEFIASIKASESDLIGFTPLTFTSSHGTSVTYGTNLHGPVHSWSSSGLGTFVGLSGWAGSFGIPFSIPNVQALSAQYVTFSPAIFIPLPKP